MQPEIIAVLQGGVVNGLSATYEERDAFGTLGGRARMEATALLAKKTPHAIVLVTDAINAKELEELGVARERIRVEIPAKNNTLEGLKVIAAHAAGSVTIVSSEYHLPRVQALWEQLPWTTPQVTFIAAESVLAENDPAFGQLFEAIKKTPAYQERLASEARGLEALKAGTYQPATRVDKKERFS